MFRRRRFFEGEPIRTGDEVRDIAWLTPGGREMTHEDWDKSFHKCVGGVPQRRGHPAPDARGERVVDDSFLLCFNAHDQYVEFVTPHDDYAQEWTAELDTAAIPPATSDLVVAAEETVPVPGALAARVA